MQVLPNYKQGSIVNLMSSIAGRFGLEMPYLELDLLRAEELAGSRNVVNIVIDGLGYEYLAQYCRDSLIFRHTRGKFTAGFPSTTASCITSYATGLAAKEHGVTGWYMKVTNNNGIDVPAIPLLYCSRVDKIDLRKLNVDPGYVFPADSIAARLGRSLCAVLPEGAVNSVYTNQMVPSSERLTYHDLDSFFGVTAAAVNKNDQSLEARYIYAYLPVFDTMFHQVGEYAPELQDLFRLIDKGVDQFLTSIKGTDTVVILTADHGLLTTSQAEKRINLNDYPHIKDTLSFPLCGEPRTAYCYLKEGQDDRFLKYVRDDLAHVCDVHKSSSLVEQGYFGLHTAAADFHNRIGDYILLMKDDYLLKDFVPGEETRFHMGNHGGLSKAEMHIPLSIFKV